MVVRHSTNPVAVPGNRNGQLALAVSQSEPEFEPEPAAS